MSDLAQTLTSWLEGSEQIVMIKWYHSDIQDYSHLEIQQSAFPPKPNRNCLGKFCGIRPRMYVEGLL